MRRVPSVARQLHSFGGHSLTPGETMRCGSLTPVLDLLIAPSTLAVRRLDIGGDSARDRVEDQGNRGGSAVPKHSRGLQVWNSCYTGGGLGDQCR